MKIIALIFSMILSLVSSFSFAYGYPYQDPYIATLNAAIAKPSERFANSTFQTNTFVYRKDRSYNEVLGDRNFAEYGTAVHRGQTAPLIFILSGTGGTYRSGLAITMAELLYRNGYHVVTLTNPFSWQFALTTSSDGMVGYAPKDAKDLYDFMTVIQKQLLRKGVKISSYSFMGYSLGALTSAYVLKADDQKKNFKFKKVVMINPPINLFDNIRSLDQHFYMGLQWSANHRAYLQRKVVEIGMYLLSRPLGPEYYLGMERFLAKAGATSKEVQWLVGATFRQTMGEVLFTSQVITDLKILKTPVSKYQRNERTREAQKFGYEDYMRKFLIPYLRSQGTGEEINVDAIIAYVSLKGIAASLKEDKRVYLMHNLDDFLFASGDEAWVADTFGERAYIYPHGGHMGNFWFPQNQKDLLNILSEN